MVTVNIHEAKTQLSKLVDRAVKGEPFVIAKAGKPLVKVAALDAPRRRSGWAFWRARSPCPTTSTAWAKPRSRPCSGAAREAPAGHPDPALGGRRARAALRARRASS